MKLLLLSSAFFLGVGGESASGCLLRGMEASQFPGWVCCLLRGMEASQLPGMRRGNGDESALELCVLSSSFFSGASQLPGGAQGTGG